MGIVIPAQKIVDLLLGEEMHTKRSQHALQETAPGAASVVGQPQPGTKTDEELRAIVRALSRPDAED
jgi:hypothetical protein